MSSFQLTKKEGNNLTEKVVKFGEVKCIFGRAILIKNPLEKQSTFWYFSQKIFRFFITIVPLVCVCDDWHTFLRSFKCNQFEFYPQCLSQYHWVRGDSWWHFLIFVFTSFIPIFSGKYAFSPFGLNNLVEFAVVSKIR